MSNFLLIIPHQEQEPQQACSANFEQHTLAVKKTNCLEMTAVKTEKSIPFHGQLTRIC